MLLGFMFNLRIPMRRLAEPSRHAPLFMGRGQFASQGFSPEPGRRSGPSSSRHTEFFMGCHPSLFMGPRPAPSKVLFKATCQ